VGFCEEARPKFALSCAHSSHGTAVPAARIITLGG
jgi:hypothetical protein